MSVIRLRRGASPEVVRWSAPAGSCGWGVAGAWNNGARPGISRRPIWLTAGSPRANRRRAESGVRFPAGPCRHGESGTRLIAVGPEASFCRFQRLCQRRKWLSESGIYFSELERSNTGRCLPFSCSRARIAPLRRAAKAAWHAFTVSTKLCGVHAQLFLSPPTTSTSRGGRTACAATANCSSCICAARASPDFPHGQPNKHTADWSVSP